jgi:hypothetical protein
MKELNASQTEEVTGALLRKRPTITTLAIGEEGGGGVTTLAIGEEGGTSRKFGEEGPIFTTLALGEEGNPPADLASTTTSALGSF